jgi:signal recognition particle receptor subunit alpha
MSTPDAPPDPYTLAFVGVNGVGKSTNLSKVCFWLLQNGCRVLIAACDTFRSGAVEQLRVHVRNLGALGEEMGMGESGRKIELYERGYGKDAAGIAKDAIAYGGFDWGVLRWELTALAKENRFDVVLIDTAGRMQDNEPLMRALAKVSRSSGLKERGTYLWWPIVQNVVHPLTLLASDGQQSGQAHLCWRSTGR